MDEFERLSRAIVAADKAGDTESVKILGQALRASQMGPPRPQQTGAQGEARAFGIGVRDVAQGLMALPGAVYNPIAAAGRAVGLPIRNLDENIDMGADALGLPRAETKSEKIASGIARGGASALPTMGAGTLMQGGSAALQRVGQMLSSNPGTQVIASGAGGGAQGAAEQGGAGPVGQFAAGLAGGAVGALGTEIAKGTGRMALAAMEPFSAQGPDRIAGRALYQASASPETVQGRIAEGMADQSRRVPGAPVTTAQAAQDPGLAIIEAGLRNDPSGGANSPAVLLRNNEFARNQARDAYLRGVSPMPIGQAPDALGATVRQSLSEAQNKAKAGVRQAYQAIEANGPAQIEPGRVAMAVAETARPRAGQAELPADLTNALDALASRTQPASIDFLQNIRSRLGVVEGQAARTGDNVTAATAKRARETLGGMMDEAAANGEGVNPQQLEAWRSAIGMRREMGATFGRSGEGSNAVESILRKDQFGAPTMLNERVVDAALSAPSNIRQVLKAAGAQGEPVRQSLKARFVDRFMESAQTRGEILDSGGNRATPLSAAQARTFWQKNQSVARELFTPEELGQFRRLMGDFAETSATQGVAASRGSPTAQNLMVGNMISRATGGLVDPTSPTAQTVVGLGPTMRLLYSAPEAATREALARALVDPQEATRLMQLAGPQGANQAAGYANSQMRDRLAQALMGELTRGGARTANALAIQGQTGP